MKYNINIEVFEGPMDLLLHLIDESKIDIYDIPINIITEEFINYLNKLETMNLEITSDFLIMASTLIEIKSKMLLPKDEKLKDDIDESDPRFELVSKLIEYKKFKSVSKELKEREIKQSKVFYKPREELVVEDEDDMTLEDLDMSQLLKAINNIIKNREKKEKLLSLNEIRKEEYTLEECTFRLETILENNDRIWFTDLLEKSKKEEVITYFLSLLELTRQGYIFLKQKEDYSDVEIIKRKDIN